VLESRDDVESMRRGGTLVCRRWKAPCCRIVEHFMMLVWKGYAEGLIVTERV
jgi:hypothetical protein